MFEHTEKVSSAVAIKYRRLINMVQVLQKHFNLVNNMVINKAREVTMTPRKKPSQAF